MSVSGWLDEALRIVVWLLPGLLVIVALLLAFSAVDHRRDGRKPQDGRGEGGESAGA